LSYVALLLVSALISKRCSEGAWYDQNFSRGNCVKARSSQLLASFLATDFSADTLLIITPLVMLWKIKLPTKERRLILALFSSSVVSLFSSIAFAVTWFFVFDSGLDSIILSSMFSLLQVSFSKKNL
jgi:hypothetical protein